MASLIVQKIPEDLKAEFKAFCARKRTTMREELIRYMARVTGCEEGADTGKKE